MKLIRDGQKVWPYCDECGCRLAISHVPTSDNYEGLFRLSHFIRDFDADIDARGHACSNINHTWLTSPDSIYVGAVI